LIFKDSVHMTNPDKGTKPMKPNLTLLTTLLLAFFCVNRAYPVDARSTKNIVIFTDDQTNRGIGYNNAEVKTPNLDARAAGGITFERGYVASPICAASRASMMTGRFPQQHGVMGLRHPAFAPYRLDGAHARQALPSRLAEARRTRRP
jgi:hypothetical protein